MSRYGQFAATASHVGVIVLFVAVTGMVLCIVALSVYTIRRGRDTGRRGRVVTEHQFPFPFMRSWGSSGRRVAVSKQKILVEKEVEVSEESLVDGTATLGEHLMAASVIAFLTSFYFVFVGIGLWMLKDSPIGLVFPIGAGFWFFGGMRMIWRDRQRTKARVAARRAGLSDPYPEPLDDAGEANAGNDTPRQRRRTGSRRTKTFWERNLLLISGGAWLAAGIACLVGGFFVFRQDQRYAQEGVTVDGVVLSRSQHTVEHHGSRRTSTSTIYDVAYSFRAADGSAHEGTSSVDAQLWQGLHDQGPVGIQYLADDPSTNRVADDSSRAGDFILFTLGGVFAVAGGALLFVDLRRRFKAPGDQQAPGRSAGSARVQRQRQRRRGTSGR